MQSTEIERLTAYLSRLFNSPDMVVLQHPEEEDQALVVVGREFFARIDRDDDEGELSYSLCKEIPDAPHEELDEAIKTMFNSKGVELRKRPTKKDSAEVYKGDEFLGVLYDDDEEAEGMQIFNMAILDIDLEPEAD
ncbi:MAG: DUF3126 family protein [Ahrensia sp.]|nr:DUF3126 family protein [Ahrensia sp.]